jgi:hypothetical protein
MLAQTLVVVVVVELTIILITKVVMAARVLLLFDIQVVNVPQVEQSQQLVVTLYMHLPQQEFQR